MVIVTTPPRRDACPDVLTTEVTGPSPIGEDPNPSTGSCPADYLIRRLKLVLFDLGLDASVPGHWITPVSEGLDFGTLTIKQGDELIRRLEDLAADRRVLASSPGPGQLSLFGNGQ